MHSVRSYDLHRGEYVTLPDKPLVLALGNFDGVHSAHRALLMRAVRLAHDRGCMSAAWCFNPPSSAYLGGAATLSTTGEKLTIFAECGLDYVCLADFPTLREYSPADFIETVLKKNAHAVHVVCGFHFRFGKGGAGDAELLKHAFGETGVDILPPICLPLDGRETVISASAVRTALLGGDMKTAALLLGRPYSLTAPVVHGKALGRTLGIPTINQNVPDGKLMPLGGIYATRVWIDGKPYIGVTNVGHRPTVDSLSAPVNCETHILDFDRDLYGETVTIEFHHRLRDEKKFNSLDELKTSVQGDIAAAKLYFKG